MSRVGHNSPGNETACELCDYESVDTQLLALADLAFADWLCPDDEEAFRDL